MVGPAADPLLARAGRAAVRKPPDERDRAAEPPVDLRGVVDQRVEAARDEIGELHLDDRAHPGDRGAHAAADDRALGDRRVEAPLRAELPGEAARDAEGAAVSAADVLAH